MKTHLSAFAGTLLLASLGGGFAATAQTSEARPVSVSVNQVADFVYLIKASNPHLALGQIRLLRATDGALMYVGGTNRRPSFGQKLNFSNLPDGQYTLVVQIGHDNHQYSLDLNTRTERTARMGTVSLTAMN